MIETPALAYLDNNILIQLENGNYKIEDLERLLNCKHTYFPYSQSHAFEWIDIKDKPPHKKEEFLKRTFGTVREVCRNFYVYQDYQTGKTQAIHRDPEDAYRDVSDSALGLTAIRFFANMLTHEQVEQIRAQFGFDTKVINNIPPAEIIDHLNTKLRVWEEKYSFVEVIETAISQFPNGSNFGTYHRFAAYFTFMDLLGYWKDTPTDNSNVARLWDSGHAFFAIGCRYFVSNDKRTRQKTRVVYDLCDIPTTVLSGEGAETD